MNKLLASSPDRLDERGKDRPNRCVAASVNQHFLVDAQDLQEVTSTAASSPSRLLPITVSPFICAFARAVLRGCLANRVAGNELCDRIELQTIVLFTRVLGEPPLSWDRRERRIERRLVLRRCGKCRQLFSRNVWRSAARNECYRTKCQEQNKNGRLSFVSAHILTLLLLERLRDHQSEVVEKKVTFPPIDPTIVPDVDQHRQRNRVQVKRHSTLFIQTTKIIFSSSDTCYYYYFQ